MPSHASCTLERNQQLRGLIEIRIDFKRKKPSLVKGKEDTKLESFAALDGSWNIAAKAESLQGSLIRVEAREKGRKFRDATTCFPAKSHLRNEYEKFHIDDVHYSDLGSSSDWSFWEENLLQPIRSTTQVWLMTRHQYGISAGVPRTVFRGVLVASRNVGCFLRLSKWTPWATSLRPSKSRQKFEGKGAHSWRCQTSAWLLQLSDAYQAGMTREYLTRLLCP